MSLEEQISAVLNDPETMNKISSIAASLGASGPEAQSGDSGPENAGPAQSPQQAPALPKAPRLPDMSADPRTRLLMALKPFLSKKRASYVDGAVALLGMMQLGSLAGGSSPLAPLMSALGRQNQRGVKA